MEINQLLQNGYLQLLGISLFVVSFNVFLFLEKIKNKVFETEKIIKDDIINKFKKKTINADNVIFIHESLTKNRIDLESTKSSIDLSLWWIADNPNSLSFNKLLVLSIAFKTFS